MLFDRLILVRHRALVVMMALLGYLASFVGARGQDLPMRPDDYTPVCDFSHVFSDSIVKVVNNTLELYYQETGYQVAVVTVDDIGKETAAGYSHALFNTWGIGNSVDNTGILLLIKPKNGEEDFGEVFIATGYGVESILMDVVCHSITNKMAPYLREGDYNKALQVGTSLIMKEIDNGVAAGNKIISNTKDVHADIWDLSGYLWEVIRFFGCIFMVYLPVWLYDFFLYALILLSLGTWIGCSISLAYQCHEQTLVWKVLHGLAMVAYLPLEFVYSACLAWAAIVDVDFSFMGRPCNRRMTFDLSCEEGSNEMQTGDSVNTGARADLSKSEAALSAPDKKRPSVLRIVAGVVFVVLFIPLAALVRILDYPKISYEGIVSKADMTQKRVEDEGRLFGFAVVFLMMFPYFLIVFVANVFLYLIGLRVGRLVLSKVLPEGFFEMFGGGSRSFAGGRSHSHGGRRRSSWGGGHSGGGGGGSRF